MTLDRLHRRLVVVMAIAGLLAFVAGAGFEPVPAILAAIGLLTALFWQPDRATAKRLEKIWLPLAAILVARVFVAVFLIDTDVVIPVVDLLLLLLCAEALRSLDAQNDVRLYALVFALFLAATAYRPGATFAIAFAALVGTGSLALSVGLVKRKARRFRTAAPPIDRRFVGTSLGLSAVTLVIAGIVFVTFPRIDRDWPGRGDSFARTIAGFSDEVSLGQHGSTIYSNPEIVLRVEFPDGRPDNPLGLHWRGRSYDNFDGVRWTRSERLRPASAPVDWYLERWTGPVIEHRIYAAPLDTRVVFGVHPIVDVDAESRMQPMFDAAGDFFYWGGNQEAVYMTSSMSAPPPADSLRSPGGGFMPDRERYLQLPRLPDRIAALADSITAGLDNDYDRAVAVRDWLRTNLDYTRELPATAAQTSLDHFIFERREGHCEYFSTAMAIMLRTQGIRARNVNGFLGGRWSEFGQYLAVTQNEAHSWVEVWFPNYGWVEFDPTPGGSLAGADALLQWSWPGQAWFDGLQFRWSKWVLEYSLTKQIDLAGALRGILGGEDEVSGSSVADGGLGARWLWALAALLVVAFGAWRMRGSFASVAPETRLYLRLLAAARRAGIVGDEEVTPLALVERVKGARPAAALPARALVGRYLSVRFGGQTYDDELRSEMKASLAAARRALSGS